MRSLGQEAGAGPRLDPLLRQIMAEAVGRSRDQGEREPPSTRQELDLVMVMVLLYCSRQDPLLRQLMDSVVDTFADTVLELPPRDQDHLLRCRVSRVTCRMSRVVCHVLPQCQGAPGGRND